MVFINRTEAYDSIVSKQKRVSFFSKASLVLAIILAVAVIVIGDFRSWSLIVGAVLLFAGFIVKLILNNIFKSNSRKIIEIFKSEYSVNNAINITHIRDNCNVENRISTKYLLSFLRGNSINFVSAKFLEIINEKNFSLAYQQYIKSDFGILSLDIDRIDNYRKDTQTTILTLVSEGVDKIEFDSNKAFETFIPKKEYFYATSKKNT